MNELSLGPTTPQKRKEKKKRLLIPFPLFLAKFTAKIFQLMPKPLITTDQLRLLKYDNVVSGKHKTRS